MKKYILGLVCLLSTSGIVYAEPKSGWHGWYEFALALVAPQVSAGCVRNAEQERLVAIQCAIINALIHQGLLKIGDFVFEGKELTEDDIADLVARGLCRGVEKAAVQEVGGAAAECVYDVVSDTLQLNQSLDYTQKRNMRRNVVADVKMLLPWIVPTYADRLYDKAQEEHYNERGLLHKSPGIVLTK
ncbi:hypothetical protein EBR77_04385 [bacterium]|nr:hypothetical protein [bacterium]NBX78321.1 hypothetical protein [bacterium]